MMLADESELLIYKVRIKFGFFLIFYSIVIIAEEVSMKMLCKKCYMQRSFPTHH